MLPDGTTTSVAIDPNQVRSPRIESVRLSPSRIHNGQRTPGPSPPVATTRDENAVNKHICSVANQLYICAKTLILPGHAKTHNVTDIHIGTLQEPHYLNWRRMRYLKTLLTGAAALLISATAFSATLEFAGVKVEDTAMVGDVKLQLNGAGIRYKGPFKVYVGELYTTKKVNTLEELIAAPGPKRLSMTFVREIEAGPFGKLLTRGVEDNIAKIEMSKLVPGLIRMGDIFTVNKVLQVGDKIYLDWIPGTGMVITAKGKLQGEPFKEPEFYKAIMSIWFGTSPADWRLKDAMLGIKAN